MVWKLAEWLGSWLNGLWAAWTTWKLYRLVKQTACGLNNMKADWTICRSVQAYSGILRSGSIILCDTQRDYDNLSLVHGSDLTVGMRSSYVLCLLLWFYDETRMKLIVGWNLQLIGSSQRREVFFVSLWILYQGHEMTEWVSRWRCWCRDEVLAAFAGARLCLLEEGTHAYCTILFWEIGNRLL